MYDSGPETGAVEGSTNPRHRLCGRRQCRRLVCGLSSDRLLEFGGSRTGGGSREDHSLENPPRLQRIAACATVLSPERGRPFDSRRDYRKRYRTPTPEVSKMARSSCLRGNHSGSSKPVRCGSPTLGRFDSGAAPLSQIWRVCADVRVLPWPEGPAPIFRSSPFKSA